MRFLGCVLIFLVCLPDTHGQLFRRRGNPCPDNYCVPVQPAPQFPPLAPVETPDDGAGIFAEIPSDLRPRNVNGNCVWDAAESVFGAAGYDEFRGIAKRAVEHGWRGAWISNLTAALEHAGIQYKRVDNGDLSIFEHARSEKVPVYIQVQVSRPNDHAVACVGLDSGHAWILDNNGPPVVQRWTRAKFDRVWNGIACCPLHKRNKARPADTRPAHPPIKPAEPASPAVDLKPLTSKVEELGQAMGKLTDSTSKIAENLGTTNTRLTSMEDRLAAAEKARCSCSGAGSTPAAPPSASRDDLAKVQEELARLKQTLKASGTLRINIEPRK